MPALFLDPPTELSPEDRSIATRSLPPVPALDAPPVRDMGQEGRRGTQAGLMGALFGLGLGRGTAPALGAAAMRGTAAGADTAYKNELAQTQDANALKLRDYELAMKRFMAESDLADNQARQESLLRDDVAAFWKDAEGLPEKDLQSYLANADVSGRLDALGLGALRRGDGTYNVSPVADSAREISAATQKSLADDRLGDSRRQFIMSLAGLSPEGRQAALALAAETGEAGRLGLPITQNEETGAYQIAGVNLDQLNRAATGANSPEAIAARSDLERQRAYNRFGQDAADTLRRFADSGRVTGKVRAELLDRVRVIGNAIRSGTEIPAYVFEISPESIANLSEKEKQQLDIAREGLGIRSGELEERKRANQAREEDRDADRTQRENKPGASLEKAQIRYEGLREQRAEWVSGEKEAKRRAAEARKKLQAITSLPQYRGPGGQARAMNHPGYWELFEEEQGADLEATRYKNLQAETDKQLGQIEARWPALKSSRKAGAQAATREFGPGWRPSPGYVPPGGAAPLLLDGGSRTIDMGDGRKVKVTIRKGGK